MDTLTKFNQQILVCQDDAYTLAWYLTGDAGEAETITQMAVEAAYECFKSHGAGCRVRLLKGVVMACQRRNNLANEDRTPGILNDLFGLPNRERLALVLVDILGLSYAEAAQVMGNPMKETSRLLAWARRGLCARQQKNTDQAINLTGIH